jgi:beta-phosphoglucomutase-like phosphatase (HAD superfamily)
MKPCGFLIDLDGVVLKNSLDLAAEFIRDYIQSLTPISIETVRSWIRGFNCYPAGEFFRYVFHSLEIESHYEDFLRRIDNFQGANGREIIVDPYFETFLKTCAEQGIRFRIASLAPIKRIQATLPFLLKEDIYSLHGMSKASPHTFVKIAGDLEIRPEEWVLIDDDPFSLRSAKIAGFRTMMVLNNFFREEEYSMYREFVDRKVRDFREIVEFLKIG